MPRAENHRRLGLVLALALLSPAGAIGATDHYEEALARFNAHEYEEAVIALKNALKEERNNLPALVLLRSVAGNELIY